MQDRPKLTIGILLYFSKEYLAYFLESLKKQKGISFEILVLDNSNGESEDISCIKENYPNIKMFFGNNLGFSKGHNFLIKKMRGEYYACINPDMIFEEGFFKNIIEKLDKDKNAGFATGKILKWNFEEASSENCGKTNIIDSCGIGITRSHHFFDIGQTEIDEGQFDYKKEVFGASGAAAIYKKEALEDIAYHLNNKGKEYFDELFFMYKEDCDLSYRLRWAGWKCLFVSEAKAYHDRTVDKKGSGFLSFIENQKSKSSKIKEWSYINHNILLYKNFSKNFSLEIKLKTWFYNFFSKIYLFFFEGNIYKDLKNISYDSEEIESKKIKTPRRINAQEIERWMK